MARGIAMKTCFSYPALMQESKTIPKVFVVTVAEISLLADGARVVFDQVMTCCRNRAMIGEFEHGDKRARNATVAK